MKKRLFYLLTLIIAIAIFVPFVGKVYADTSTMVQYANVPHANLQGVIDFGITENEDVYLAYDNEIKLYSNSTISNFAETTSEISKIYVANNQLIVLTQDRLVMYDNMHNTIEFDSITNYTCVDVCYYDEKYVVAYVDSGSVIINTYTTPNAVDNTYSHTVSETNYYLSIIDNTCYLMDQAANNLYRFNYLQTEDNYTSITNVNLNFTSKNNFVASNSHFVVSMTDIIRVVNISTYAKSEKTFTISASRAFITGEINSVKSLKFANNKLYILDQNNLSIQSFNITDDILDNASIVLASFGGDINRLYHVNSIALKSDDLVYVSDNGNSRINVVGENVTTLLDNVKANDLIMDEYNNLYFYTTTLSTSTIYKYSLNNGFTLVDSYNVNFVIYSMCIDNQNNIYVLGNDNTIYSSPLSQFELNSFVNLDDSSITTNSSSKIGYLFSSGKLIVSSDSILYLVDDTVLTKDFNENILDFAIDFEENIFVVTDGGIVAKYNFESNLFVAKSDFDNCTVITLNQLTGTLYLFDSNTSEIIVHTDTSFSAGMGNFEHYDTTIGEQVADNYIHNYAQIDGLIFEYPNYIGKAYNLNGEVSNVVLVCNTPSTTGFEYVMFELNDSIYFGYAKTSDLTYNTDSIVRNSTNVVTIEKSIDVFKYPTLHCETKISSYNRNNVISTFATYPINVGGRKYYVVELQDGYGYIYAGDVTAYESSYNNNVSPDNAYVTTHDHTDYVTVYSDNLGQTEVEILSRNKRVYVVDYDKNLEFTLIKYLDSNGKEKMGYVATKYVHMDNNNTLIICAIVCLVFGLIAGAVLTINYIKYKKK